MNYEIISKEDWLNEIGAEVVKQQKLGLQDGIEQHSSTERRQSLYPP